MNRERMKQLLPIMKAFAEGAVIECRIEGSGSRWSETVSPTWRYDTEYRVKPAPPSVMWVIYNKDGSSCFYLDAEDKFKRDWEYVQKHGVAPPYSFKKFQEVIEDESDHCPLTCM